MPAETHVGRERIGPGEVLACVRTHAAEIFSVDEGAITRDSRLMADLDADSIAVIELVEAIEEELGERTVGFAIDDDDLGDFVTVGDLVDTAVARLEPTTRPDGGGRRE